MSHLTATARELRKRLGPPPAGQPQPFDSWSKAQLWERILELEGKLIVCRGVLSRAKAALNNEGHYDQRNEAGKILDRTEFSPAAMGRRS
jgi:hypothetical protein